MGNTKPSTGRERVCRAVAQSLRVEGHPVTDEQVHESADRILGQELHRERFRASLSWALESYAETLRKLAR